jgi:hypothetical protein
MKKILLSIISVVLGVSMIAQTSSNLKLNLEKNKVYRFKSTTEQTITQTMNGVPQTTNVKSISYASVKMMESKPEFMIAEVKFDTINTQTNTMGKIANINSANSGNLASSDATDVMTCIMNRLSKNSLFVKLSYDGKVIEIINSKMLCDIIMKDTSSITGASAQVLKMQIKNSINDIALKTMVETFTYNLPNKTVSKGNKWEIASSTNAGGMSLDFTTIYVLDEIKSNIANISAESNIKASENAKPLEYPGATITYGDLKGIGKSKILLDVNTGLINENSGKTQISGNLSISAQGMNMQMPMEISVDSKVVAVK